MAKKLSLVAGVPGSDPTLPKVALTVNGKKFWLVYNYNAIAKAEELTGLNLLRSMDFQNLNATCLRAYLYSALLKGNPEITLDEVGDMITIHSIGAITAAIVEAWTGSVPEVVEAAKVNPPVEQGESL